MVSLRYFLNAFKIGTVIGLLLYMFGVTKSVYPTKYPRQFGNMHSVHKTLYLDKSFNAFYAVEIKLAADRWSSATNHIASFDVEVITDKNRNRARTDPEAVIVTMVTEDHPDVLMLDEQNSESTIAFCDMRYSIPILAYVEVRIADQSFEKVTLHELGHALLLEHVYGTDGIGQVMYPSTDLMSEVITQKDLEQFCEIYHCDAKKLKNEEESLHL